MTVRLVVLRHAEAEGMRAGDDRDQPLTGRGLQDASRMGLWLRDHGWVPDRVFCSPAQRAQQTAALALEAMGLDSTVLETVDRLYLASLETLLDMVRDLEGKEGTWMIVGHNPGLSQLVQAIADEPVVARDGQVLPTATAACFDDGRLQVLRRPKDL